MPEKLIYPSATRNAGAIIQCLSQYLPAEGRILEIASGLGQHISGLAARFPAISWQPSDPDAEARASISAWARSENGANLLLPLDIDVTEVSWSEKMANAIDGIVAINMLHVAPGRACLGLLQGAGALLPSGGVLYLYGPYKIDGEPWAASNEAFDASLRARNPQWGIRNRADVVDAAAGHDLEFADCITMPANNISLIFRKA